MKLHVPLIILCLVSFGLTAFGFDYTHKKELPKISRLSEFVIYPPSIPANKEDSPIQSVEEKVLGEISQVQETAVIENKKVIALDNSTSNFYLSSASNLAGVQLRTTFVDGSQSDIIAIQPADFIESAQGQFNVSELYDFDKTVQSIELNNLSGQTVNVEMVNSEIPSFTPLKAAGDVNISQLEMDYKKELFSNLGINFVTREEWGAPTYSAWGPEISKVNRFVIHHTAMNVNMSDTAASVREIYNYHRNICSNNVGSYPANCTADNTWSDIGYNYLIDPNGKVFEGRSGGNGVIGAHSIPNSGSVGIAIMGTFTTTPPTDAALNSLKTLVAKLSVINNITPTYEVNLFGHRHYQQTACPGQKLFDLLPSIAADSVTIKNSLTELNTSLSEIDIMLGELGNIEFHDGNSQLVFQKSQLSETDYNRLTNQQIYGVYEQSNKLYMIVGTNTIGQILKEYKITMPEYIIKPSTY